MNEINVANDAGIKISVMRKKWESVNITINQDTAFFDMSSRQWRGNEESNRIFLLLTQGYANDKLRLNGELSLDEVCEMLDVRHSYGENGRKLGWRYSDNEPVDFGLYDIDSIVRGMCYWPNGEPFIMLHFNAYDISK